MAVPQYFDWHFVIANLIGKCSLKFHHIKLQSIQDSYVSDNSISQQICLLSQVSSSPSSSHVKDDSAIDNIVLENENQHRHSSRDANKNKIFASLICLTKSRSSANKDTLSATTTLTNNSAAKEKHRKQKDASRKERKATQTLAIVLGKFV